MTPREARLFLKSCVPALRDLASSPGCLALGPWKLELPAVVRLYQATPEPQAATLSPHPIYPSKAKNLLGNQDFACNPRPRNPRLI